MNIKKIFLQITLFLLTGQSYCMQFLMQKELQKQFTKEMNTVITSQVLHSIKHGIKNIPRKMWNSSFESKIKWITSLSPIPNLFNKKKETLENTKHNRNSIYQKIDLNSKEANVIKKYIPSMPEEQIKKIYFLKNNMLIFNYSEIKNTVDSPYSDDEYIYLPWRLDEFTTAIDKNDTNFIHKVMGISIHEYKHISNNDFKNQFFNKPLIYIITPLLTTPTMKIAKNTFPIVKNICKKFASTKKTGRFKQYLKGALKGDCNKFIANIFIQKKSRVLEYRADEVNHPNKEIQLELIDGLEEGLKEINYKLNCWENNDLKKIADNFPNLTFLTEQNYNKVLNNIPEFLMDHPKIENRLQNFQRQREKTKQLIFEQNAQKTIPERMDNLIEKLRKEKLCKD